MSKPSKTAANPASPDEMAFEEALGKLEAVLEEMEGDQLPLETLLTRFEEGTRLVQLCQKRLSEAELKIQQLEKQAGGHLNAVDLPTPPDLAGDGTP